MKSSEDNVQKTDKDLFIRPFSIQLRRIKLPQNKQELEQSPVKIKQMKMTRKNALGRPLPATTTMTTRITRTNADKMDKTNILENLDVGLGLNLSDEQRKGLCRMSLTKRTTKKSTAIEKDEHGISSCFVPIKNSTFSSKNQTKKVELQSNLPLNVESKIQEDDKALDNVNYKHKIGNIPDVVQNKNTLLNSLETVQKRNLVNNKIIKPAKKAKIELRRIKSPQNFETVQKTNHQEKQQSSTTDAFTPSAKKLQIKLKRIKVTENSVKPPPATTTMKRKTANVHKINKTSKLEDVEDGLGSKGRLEERCNNISRISRTKRLPAKFNAFEMSAIHKTASSFVPITNSTFYSKKLTKNEKFQSNHQLNVESKMQKDDKVLENLNLTLEDDISSPNCSEESQRIRNFVKRDDLIEEILNSDENECHVDNSNVDKIESTNAENEEHRKSRRDALQNVAKPEVAVTTLKKKKNTDEIIEEILNSDAEQVNEEQHRLVDTKTIEKESQKSHRFFHRNVVQPETATSIQSEIIIKKKKKNIKPSSKQSTVGNRRSVLKRKMTTSDRNIFDFLSQTESSETDNDPAADIIRKLIAEGRVRVATTRKGTGRPIIKHKRKNVLIIKKKPPTKKGKKSKKQEKHMLEVEEDDNHFDNEDVVPYPQEGLLIEPSDIRNKPSSSATNANRSFVADGTFSRLARSVLMQQTGKSNSAAKKLADQRKLLEVARKFVSTPVSKSLPPRVSNLSPIELATSRREQNQQLGNTSPWRVNDDDGHLPTVFHFNTSSSNLPSFSSDTIPSTPQKKNHKKIDIPKIRNEILNSSLAPLDDISFESEAAALKNSCKVSSINEDTAAVGLVSAVATSQRPLFNSSYSSNDSNAENMPPQTQQPLQHALGNLNENVDENADIFNLRQLPNPRRQLSHRSPLKAINIIEVVTLPSWKNLDKTNNVVQEEAKKSTSNLFGFEEFLNETDQDEYDEINNDNQKVVLTTKKLNSKANHENVPNKSLRDKLHELKKWRPDDKIIPHPTTKQKPITHIFDENQGGPKQRCLKQMLCSTMINQSIASIGIGEVANDEDDMEKITNRNEKGEEVQPDLFKDFEPESTFNAKNSYRTYSRPAKRKRKMRHNFVMFLSSEDESDEDDDYHNHEKDKKSKKDIAAGNKKKRQRKLDKSNEEELDEYVKEFNEECNEVDKYELRVD